MRRNDQQRPLPWRRRRLPLAGLLPLSLGLFLFAFLVASPLAASLPAGPRPASASIVYQQGVSPSPEYAGASDTFISHVGDQVANYGSSQTLLLRSSDQRAALLRFELEGLASGDIIQHAVLSVYVSDHTMGTADVPLSLYRVLRPWVENEANWYNATAGDLWTLAGCNSPSADRSSVPSAGATLNTTGIWVDLDITRLVQAWVDHPASNFGVILKAGNTGQPGDEYGLRSGNYAAEPETRPRLSISYTPAGEGSLTPTPTVAYGQPADVVFQQLVNPAGYSGTYDTYISDYGDPDNNYGGESAVRLRSNDHRASLIRFDISSIPANALVYGATLNLYVQSRTNINPLAVTAYRLLHSWNDMQATWYDAALDQPWSFPGANGLTTDRSAEAFAGAVLDATGVWSTWDVRALAQDWIANPDANFGVIFKAGSGTQVEYSLVAGHYLANPSLRPYLDISYALPLDQTPAPAVTRSSTPTATRTATPPATATQVVFQFGQAPDSGYDSVLDAYISRDGDLTTNYGADPLVTVGSNDMRAALLRFDLSRIPPWATVQSAQLSLYTDSAGNGYPMGMGAHRLLRDWTEMGATWMQTEDGVPWASAGANGLGVDRVATTTAAITVSTLGDWYNLNITDMARAWVAAPEQNFGLILKGIGGPQVSYDFVSSQYLGQGAALRPKLTLIYSLPSGPTPTPTNTRTPTATPQRMFWYLPVIVADYTPPPIATSTETPVTETPTATPSATATPSDTATPTATPVQLTVVFRQGTSPAPSYDGVQDTYISDYVAADATTNFGNSTTLALRPLHRSDLLRFDVSAIPPSATVVKASLSLYVSSIQGSAPLTVTLHEALRHWVGGEATWLIASTANAWAGPGASAAGDRNPQAAAGETLSQADTYYDVDVQELVQAWVANPGRNQGVVLTAEGTADLEYLLGSSESANTSHRPKLVVIYQPAQ